MCLCVYPSGITKAPSRLRSRACFLVGCHFISFLSFSCALVLNLSHSESKSIFLPFTRALFASLQQRLSFFFRVMLFRSLTRPLSLPLFPCLSQFSSLSLRVIFCLTSLAPPPPLILSSLVLFSGTSPPLTHTESRVDTDTDTRRHTNTEDKTERLREIMT